MKTTFPKQSKLSCKKVRFSKRRTAKIPKKIPLTKSGSSENKLE